MQNDGSALTRQRVYCRRRSTIEEPVPGMGHGRLPTRKIVQAAVVQLHDLPLGAGIPSANKLASRPSSRSCSENSGNDSYLG